MNSDLTVLVCTVLPVLLIGAILALPNTRSKLIDDRLKFRIFTVVLFVVGGAAFTTMSTGLFALAFQNELPRWIHIVMVVTTLAVFLVDAMLAGLSALATVHNDKVAEMQAEKSRLEDELSKLKSSAHEQRFNETLLTLLSKKDRETLVGDNKNRPR